MESKGQRCLKNLNFKQSFYEPCLYIKKTDNLLTIIALYVDGFLIFSNDKKDNEKLRKALNSEFKIEDLGEVKAIPRNENQ